MFCSHLSSDDSNLGNGGFGIRKEELGSLADDAIVFLISACGQNVYVNVYINTSLGLNNKDTDIPDMMVILASFPDSTAQRFLHFGKTRAARFFPKCKKRWAVESGNEARPFDIMAAAAHTWWYPKFVVLS